LQEPPKQIYGSVDLLLSLRAKALAAPYGISVTTSDLPEIWTGGYAVVQNGVPAGVSTPTSQYYRDCLLRLPVATCHILARVDWVGVQVRGPLGRGGAWPWNGILDQAQVRAGQVWGRANGLYGVTSNNPTLMHWLPKGHEIAASMRFRPALCCCGTVQMPLHQSRMPRDGNCVAFRLLHSEPAALTLGY
jgi:hypothetical protein